MLGVGPGNGGGDQRDAPRVPPHIRAALKRIPGLVRAVDGLRRTRAGANALVHGLTGSAADRIATARGRGGLQLQGTFERDGVADQARLTAELAAGRIDHQVTERATYVAGRAPLATLLGDLSLYPDDAVFKVTRPGVRIADALLVANVLRLRGAGPRVLDGFVVREGSSRRPVFAIAPEEPWSFEPEMMHSRAEDEITALLKSRTLTAAAIPGGLATRGTLEFEDLRVRNQRSLVRSILREGRRDLHYGTEHAIRGGRYLYQSVPSAHSSGRRNSRRRWDAIRALLADTGTSADGRLVLDVGCNAGMMMGGALSDRAAWALGWDLPQVVRHNRPLMLALGYTRFDMFGADLTSDYRLLDDVPPILRPRLDRALILYLALRHNVGYFLSCLGEMPWEIMVYEGGEEESVSTLPETLSELRSICDFSVARALDYRDSETGSRPLALLVRS